MSRTPWLLIRGLIPQNHFCKQDFPEATSGFGLADLSIDLSLSSRKKLILLAAANVCDLAIHRTVNTVVVLIQILLVLAGSCLGWESFSWQVLTWERPLSNMIYIHMDRWLAWSVLVCTAEGH